VRRDAPSRLPPTDRLSFRTFSYILSLMLVQGIYKNGAFSSFPAFNQEKLGLAAKAFVFVKAVYAGSTKIAC
jgi:hypothetical protein